MSCLYCLRVHGHDPRCPNYVPPKASCYCSICGGGIYDGEEYIENDIGDYAHYDCLTSMSCKNMIEWFGSKIQIMNDD